MQSNKHVADSVRAEMARKRITQDLLAKHLHLSQAAISRRLKGEVGFSVSEIIATAHVIGQPVSILLGEKSLDPVFVSSTSQSSSSGTDIPTGTRPEEGRFTPAGDAA